MISTSASWKVYSDEVGVFHIKGTITSGGTTLNLTDADFMENSVSVTDSISGTQSFNIGSVITNSFKCTLNNYTGKFNNFVLGGAIMTVQFGIVYDEAVGVMGAEYDATASYDVGDYCSHNNHVWICTTAVSASAWDSSDWTQLTEEWIYRGVYTIEKPTSLGSTIQIVGYDNMDKLNQYYDGKKYAGSNKFNPNSVTVSRYIDSSGNVQNNPYAFYCTMKIESQEAGAYFETNAPTSSAICFFSKNELNSHYFISSTTPTNGVVFVPSTAQMATMNGYIVPLIESHGTYYYFRAVEGEVLSSMPTYYPSDMFAKVLCDRCGVTYDSNMWELDVFDCQPGTMAWNESTTFRQVLSWLLQVSGGYARVNESGNLECKSFNISNMGNGFSLSKLKTLNVFIDDITITGVRAYVNNTVDEFQYSQSGTDGYVIAIQDNPLVRNLATEAPAVATRVGTQINGLTFVPFDASLYGDPSIEAGDYVELVDYLGNQHDSLITSLTYSVNTAERIECNAETPKENSNAVVSASTSIVSDSVTATLDTMGDYIIESGTSGDWTYEKWKSGKAVCWGKLTQAITSWSAWGNAYEGLPTVQGTYPTDLFYSTPTVQVTADGSAGGIMSVETYTGASKTKTPQMYAVRPNSSTSMNVPIYVIATGVWK